MTHTPDTTAPPSLCPTCGLTSRDGTVRDKDGAREAVYLCAGPLQDCDRIWIVRWMEVA